MQVYVLQNSLLHTKSRHTWNTLRKANVFEFMCGVIALQICTLAGRITVFQALKFNDIVNEVIE